MKTHDEIHDMIQNCEGGKCRKSVERIVDILEHLNNRVSHLEMAQAKAALNVRERPKEKKGKDNSDLSSHCLYD